MLMLGQIEVQMAQGKSLALACKEADVSERSCATSACARRLYYSLKEAIVIGL